MYNCWHLAESRIIGKEGVAKDKEPGDVVAEDPEALSVGDCTQGLPKAMADEVLFYAYTYSHRLSEASLLLTFE